MENIGFLTGSTTITSLPAQRDGNRPIGNGTSLTKKEEQNLEFCDDIRTHRKAVQIAILLGIVLSSPWRGRGVFDGERREVEEGSSISS